MNIDLIKKYNQAGPRYTSYPPATFFHDSFKEQAYCFYLENSNINEPENISFYVHIPFCKQLCHFCGCNTTLFDGDALVKKYVDALIKEIKNVLTYINKNRYISQIHWGGGTPNSISLDLVARVMAELKRCLLLTPNAEIAMECNPAYLEFEDINRLAEIGFNRLSLGIQDFNPKILESVNRLPSKHPVKDLVNHMKKKGFKGLNLDLIYGLPNQNIDNFKESIQKAIEISPDRIVTFSYAHVPWVKPAQKQLESIGLPRPDEKLAMFEAAHKMLLDAGYVSIGMDHYAKPDDELSIALKNKTLHRNFQGYCTRETTGQVYGFGATSISQLYGAYIQNIKNVKAYIEAINNSGFAVEKGYGLSFEDQVRRMVINEIMCNGIMSFEKMSENCGLSIDQVKEITGFTMEKIQPFISDGLADFQDNTLYLKEDGFYVVRNIAMAFDPLLDVSNAKYSKTV